jgi:y4mF family transcriptional regulator
MAYKKATAMDSRSAKLQLKLGEALLKSGDSNGAMGPLGQAGAGGQARAWKLLGDASRQQGDAAGANSYYQKYLATNPPDAAAVRVKGGKGARAWEFPYVCLLTDAADEQRLRPGDWVWLHGAELPARLARVTAEKARGAAEATLHVFHTRASPEAPRYAQQRPGLRELVLDPGKKYYPNEFCTLVDAANPKKSALAKVDATGSRLVPIIDCREGVWGIKPSSRWAPIRAHGAQSSRSVRLGISVGGCVGFHPDREDHQVRVESAADLGQAAKAQRLRLGMTQAEVALVAGVGVRFIGELEAGKPTLQLERVVQVVRALGFELQLALP